MKRGFTLVELLAVIVILAVIALITIPAVMRIIDSSTTNSYRRSIDLYGKAVSQAVVSYESDMVEKGKGINVTFNNIESYIEYEGNDVDCKDKTIYSDKTILLTECYVDEELIKAEKNKGYGDENYYYYTNSKKKAKLIKYIEAVEEEIKDKNISGTCNISEDKITCNSQDINIKSKLENAIEGSLTIENNKVKSYSNLRFETEKKVETNNEVPQVIDEENTNNGNNNNNQTSTAICKSKNGIMSTDLGAEYECEVKEGTKYNFYVLSKEENNVNLIMDRNICEDGTTNYSSLNNYCRYEWHEYNVMENDPSYSFGPSSAMYVLYNATKNWNKISEVIMNYNQQDDGYNSASYGYKKIKTDINTGKTQILGNADKVLTEIGTFKYPLKTRLPMKEEIVNSGCNNSYNSCPNWLAANLDGENIKGFWLLPFATMEDRGSYVRIWVYNVSYNKNLTYTGYSENNVNGVRPVITVPISYLH